LTIASVGLGISVILVQDEPKTEYTFLFFLERYLFQNYGTKHIVMVVGHPFSLTACDPLPQWLVNYYC